MEVVKLALDAKYGEIDNEAIFTRDPRFGTWSVSFKRGAIPAILTGQWFSLKDLMTKTEIYLSTRKDNKATLGAPVETREEDGVGRSSGVREPKKSGRA